MFHVKHARLSKDYTKLKKMAKSIEKTRGDCYNNTEIQIAVQGEQIWAKS